MLKRLSSFMIAIAILLGLFDTGYTVFAQDTPSFTLDKKVIIVDGEDEFTLTIKAKDIKNMYAFEAALRYEKDKLKFVEAASDMEGYKFHREKDDILYFAYTKVGENARTESGDMDICKLTFGSVKEDTEIILEEVTIVDKNAAGELNRTVYTIGETAKVSIKSTEDPTPAPTPTPTPTPTPGPTPGITTTKDGNATIVSVSVKATADTQTGVVTAKVSTSTIADMIEQVKEAEAGGQKAVIGINVDVAADAKAVIMEIPQAAFKQFADNTNAELKMDAGIGTIIFDEKAVDAVSNSASSGDISIGIEKVDKASLSEEIQKKVGDRPVYDFTVKAGNTEISDFGGGKVEISIPYALKAGEKENAIVVCYIDSTGGLQTIRGRYDPETKTVKFTVRHFSRYVILYNEVSFSDVGDTDWYSDAVGFMAARGIVNGVGGGKFAPADYVTRADFLVMVMRAYGIEIDTDITDNFSDAGNKYYTRYLGTAKRLGFTFGVGDNKFAPETTISRQDMFVLLYRILSKLDELPSGTIGRQLESFADADNIAGYAKEAMKLFVETGIISGDGNHLAPKSFSTRAQTAQVLYNLLSK